MPRALSPDAMTSGSEATAPDAAASETTAPEASAPAAETAAPAVHILGIRHHGPGSARSLKLALETLQPDIVLVEGPPEAEAVLPLLVHEEMKPPVALLAYQADRVERAAYYPFAEFSPEWQALQFALSRGIPARFMDLPMAHVFGLRNEAEQKLVAQLAAAEEADGQKVPEGEAHQGRGGDEPGAGSDDAELLVKSPDVESPEEARGEEQVLSIRRDPLRWLAEAAGYNDSERWWEQMVEHRRDGADVFAAILEAMTALRAEVDKVEEQTDAENVRHDALREAHMRQTIRLAQREGFQRIAVVCGAWHGPALADMPPARDDAALLKGLPKEKVQTTWVPWTYDRLCFAGGYGAGIESPGWYAHLWSSEDRIAVRWMTRVARLLREQDLDASSASVIEAVRLAETLAALRDRPLPGLPELNEATQSVLCFGNDLPLQLISRRLIIGEELGVVPEETPAVPLQQDLQREQKRLRLAPEATQKVIDLDLRKPNDLERSYLLHRLNLLGIPWGKTERTWGKTGTFHEGWRLQWQPEFTVRIIERARWGNTVRDAATGFANDTAEHAPDLMTLTKLLDAVLLADVPATGHIMERLQNQAAVTSDVTHLMAALPPLANVLRYGNVRQTDTSSVAHIVNGLVARIAIGLPAAASALNDEAAAAMLASIDSVQGAIALLQNPDYSAPWQNALRRLTEVPNINGLLAGRSNRILLDDGSLTHAEVAQRMSLALSTASDPAGAAAWLEGFLKGSGLLLLHDDALWQVLDGWLSRLSTEVFTELLPLLRRTFSTFAAPERRQMGERVRREGAQPGTADSAVDEAGFDAERAASVLPLLRLLLGYESTGA